MDPSTILDLIRDFVEPVIPQALALILVMIAVMVVPQFLSSSVLTSRGDVSPSATPFSRTVISGKMLEIISFCFQNKNISRLSYFDLKTLFTGNNVFAELALVGAGQLVAAFDLPPTNDNFAAIAGMTILDNK